MGGEWFLGAILLGVHFLVSREQSNKKERIFMRRLLKRCGRITMVGMILAIYMVCMPVYAAEIGTITTLSEKVYENMDANSNVVANVIMGGTFSLLAAEFDEEGNVWYLIETDMGVKGYVQAQNVVNMKQVEEAIAAQQEASQNKTSVENENQAVESIDEPEQVSEENEDKKQNNDDEDADTKIEDVQEDNGQDNIRRQIETMQAVNIRKNASIEEDVVGKIPQGTILDCISTQENEIGEIWYEITYSGIHGYVRESTVNVIETVIQEEADLETGNEINLPYEAMPQHEEKAEETTEESTQISEQQVEFEETLIQENAEEPSAKWLPRRFRMDWIVVFSFLGCLLCMAEMYYLLRRMLKIYKRMR